MDITNFTDFDSNKNIVEVTFEFQRHQPTSLNSIVKDLKKFAADYNFTINEDIGKTGDTNVGYGVKGDLKAQGEMDNKTVVNPSTEITKDDIKTLSEVDSKITRGLQLFGDLDEFLKQYHKINHKPIQQVIDQLKSFQEAIQKELENLPQ